MSNKVSFIIQLKDQFGRTAAKVNRQFEKMKRTSDKAKRSVVAFAKKGQAALGDFGRKAAKTGAIMTAALTVPIALLSKRMIDAASDAQETADKFRVIFEEVEGAGDSAARLASKYKLASSTSKELLASTGAIISASGMNKKRVLELSEAVGGLSIDLASMHNFTGTAAESTMILSKALLGEAESLKTNFGITILQNKEFQKAVKLKQRLTGVTQQAAKAEVIFADIMRQAKGQKAIDNFNITLESYANQQRVAAEAGKELSEAFGVLLLPMATKMTKALTRLAKWVTNLSKPMKTLILTLGGLVAIAGPLLIVAGALAMAFATISIAALPIIGIIALLIVAGAMLYANWDGIIGGLKAIWQGFADFIDSIFSGIGDTFTLLFEGRLIDAMKSWANIGIKIINKLIEPLDFIANLLGFDVGTIKIPEFNINIDDAVLKRMEAPSAPSQSSNGTLSGQITVAAEKGSSVKETRMSTKGSNFHIGMNMMGSKI